MSRYVALALLLLSYPLADSTRCHGQTIIKKSNSGGTQITIVPNGGTPLGGTGTSAFGAGQTVYRLYDADNRIRETATANNSQLQIYSGGVIYLYRRARQYDTRRAYGYYNQTYDKVIRWPLSNRGQLIVADQRIGSSFVFRNGYHIGPLSGLNPPPPPPRRPRQVVVIESALPGGGLVTPGYGEGGSVQIGDANPNVTRNQFYLQDIVGGYFSLVPVVDRRMIVDVDGGRAEDGTNLHVLNKRNTDERATRFRLRTAPNGFYYIETQLRRGFVWTVDGNLAANGSNIRISREIGQTNQMFRIATPADAGHGDTANYRYEDPWNIFPDRNRRAPAATARASQPVQIKLANSQVFELWVLLLDKRDPNNPQRIKIPPKSAVDVTIYDGGGVSQLFNELSVYRLVEQSVVIDASGPGPEVVTERNFSPKSVGWFQIPFAKQENGGTMDAYRRAVDSYNPGKVVRIDPAIWNSLDADEQSAPGSGGRGTDPPDDNPTADPPIEDDDSPFGVAQLPQTSYRNTALAEYLNLDDEYRVTPGGELPLCLAKMQADGTLSVEQIVWQTIAYTATVERVVDGKQVEAQETRTKPKLITWPHKLSPDQAQIFLADGRRLSQAEAQQALQAEVPAVLLQDGWVGKLEVQHLAMLKPSTPIIVSTVSPNGGDLPSPTRLQQQQLPTTPIAFAGLEKSAGGMNLLSTYAETIEQNYTVEIPVTEEIEVDGKLVTKTRLIEETRTRSLSVVKEKATPAAPGSFRLYEMSGQKLSSDATDRFAAPAAVVYVRPGQIVDPWYRKVLRPETALFIERGR